MAKILDGKKLSEELASELKRTIEALKTKPKLVIIQVGDLPESNTYIKHKIAFATEIGALVEHKKFPEEASDEDLVSEINQHNADRLAHGIIVQLPIPKHLDSHKIIESINPAKDVDGLTSTNTKLLFDNDEAFIPATAKGIVTLLEKHQINLAGKKVALVGESSLVGRPIALALLNRLATVTVCHRSTENLAKETRNADIIIVAAGHPQLITAQHVSPHQTVIDVGINVVNEKIVGDVDYENVSEIVENISPVPGGVGPMTIVSLFQNLLTAYNLQSK